MARYSDLIAERNVEFGSNYGDFETQDLVNLLIAAGEFLERLTGETEPVGVAMKFLYSATSGYAAPDDRNWKDIWLEAGMEPGVVKMSDYFVNLNAFAYYGLPIDQSLLGAQVDGASKESLGENYGLHLQKGKELLDSVPPNWADLSEIRRTLLAAEARLRLDTGQGVSVEQIAALAKVSTKSIRNLLAPGSGAAGLSLNDAGEIDAVDGLLWLNKRPEFKSSLWWPQDSVESTIAQHSANALSEVNFVPVAKDGSWFHPVECRNSRGYTIGPKGAEVPTSDYFEALSILQKAPTANWRRPNPQGNWGIVVGISWERKERAEIEKLLDGEAE